MIIKTLHTRSGYRITITYISDTVNSLCINDCNLYSDDDYRSEEKREWVIPFNDRKNLLELAQLIQEVCTQ